MDQQERLWQAAEKGDCGEIRRAVISGADLNARNDQGLTAMNIATKNNHPEAIRTILAARHIADMAKMQIAAASEASVAAAEARKASGPVLTPPTGPLTLELEPEEDHAPVFEEEPRKWWFLGLGRRSA